MRFASLTLGLGLTAAFVAAACSSSSSPSDPGSSSSGNAAPGGSSPSIPPDSSGDDVPGGEATPRGPNVTLTTESMQVNGRARTYILAVPTKYDRAKVYPLVMVFHGNPGDAEGMVKNLPFDGASKQNAILAYPNGIGNNWDLSTPLDENQDMAFIRALSDEIARKYSVDERRVFGSGYSGGGFFLNQMACRVPGVFKAFASHSGGSPFNMTGENYPRDRCLPCSAGMVPSIHTHGRLDTDVGVDSGYYAASCWSVTNACSRTDPNQWAAVAPAPCTTAPGCTDAPVTLCWVDGLGHYQWSEGANAAWSFFESLP